MTGREREVKLLAVSREQLERRPAGGTHRDQIRVGSKALEEAADMAFGNRSVVDDKLL